MPTIAELLAIVMAIVLFELSNHLVANKAGAFTKNGHPKAQIVCPTNITSKL